MNNAYLSLGSNEGKRTEWLQKAIEFIALRCGNVTRESSIYETAAWGITTQPDFLNMVILVETPQSSSELLHTLLYIETTLGRHRTQKWGPRTIDLDILLYNNDIVNIPGLIIPHPFMRERRFTLIPLAELAPEYIHPQFNKTIADLLTDCPDKLEVHKFQGNS